MIPAVLPQDFHPYGGSLASLGSTWNHSSNLPAVPCLVGRKNVFNYSQAMLIWRIPLLQGLIEERFKSDVEVPINEAIVSHRAPQRY